MSAETTSPSIRMRVVYEDLPDLVELQTSVRAARWSGVATAYACPRTLRQSAEALLKWTDRPDGDFKLEVGSSTNSQMGWLVLSFHSVDMAGHIVCQVHLAAMAQMRGNFEDVSRLVVAIPTESGLIERFARQLLVLADCLNGEAVLEGTI